jgi:hypothetical protein
LESQCPQVLFFRALLSGVWASTDRIYLQKPCSSELSESILSNVRASVSIVVSAQIPHKVYPHMVYIYIYTCVYIYIRYKYIHIHAHIHMYMCKGGFTVLSPITEHQRLGLTGLLAGSLACLLNRMGVSAGQPRAEASGRGAAHHCCSTPLGRGVAAHCHCISHQGRRSPLAAAATHRGGGADGCS